MTLPMGEGSNFPLMAVVIGSGILLLILLLLAKKKK